MKDHCLGKSLSPTWIGFSSFMLLECCSCITFLSQRLDHCFHGLMSGIWLDICLLHQTVSSPVGGTMSYLVYLINPSTIAQSLVLVLSRFSRVWLFATPWTVAHWAPLSMGILQARILEWVAMPFFRGSSQPRDQTQVSCIAGGVFTVWATREAQPKVWGCINTCLMN